MEFRNGTDEKDGWESKLCEEVKGSLGKVIAKCCRREMEELGSSKHPIATNNSTNRNLQKSFTLCEVPPVRSKRYGH